MANAATRTRARPRPDSAAIKASPTDIALERAMEGLFRLGANRRFDQHQATAVGAVVTRAGYAVLRTLADNDSLSMREVARASAMDVATASRQIAPLVAEGLIDRRSGADDARRVEVRLTARGRRIYERIVAYRLGQMTTVLDDWSIEDRRQLTTLVSRLSRDLARIPRD